MRNINLNTNKSGYHSLLLKAKDSQGNIAPDKICMYAYDNESPTAEKFDIQSKLTSGLVEIVYYVQDTGGSKVREATFWRRVQGGAWPKDPVKKVALSTNNSGVLSWSDSPKQGIYDYGIHILDGAGNYVKDAKPVISNVIVDKTGPKANSFNVQPRAIKQGSQLKYHIQFLILAMLN